MATSPGRRVAVVGCEAADIAAFTRNLAAALMREGRDVVLIDERSEPIPQWRQGDGKLILIQAALDSQGALSPAAADADHILVVLQAHAESIKASYSCIKRLSGNHALRCFRVLVEGAADASEAQRILANLAHAGRRYLSLALDPAGWVRADPHLAGSKRLNVTVVEAFQSSPAALDYRHVACGLLHWPQVRQPGQMHLRGPAVVAEQREPTELALH